MVRCIKANEEFLSEVTQLLEICVKVEELSHERDMLLSNKTPTIEDMQKFVNNCKERNKLLKRINKYEKKYVQV